MLNPLTQTEIYTTKDEHTFEAAQKKLTDAGIALYTWSNEELPFLSCCGGADARKFGRKDGRLLTVYHIAVNRKEVARAKNLLDARGDA